ncbi:hypothetical protein GN956_G12002 [Arapaima gigas]
MLVSSIPQPVLPHSIRWFVREPHVTRSVCCTGLGLQMETPLHLTQERRITCPSETHMVTQKLKFSPQDI